MKDITDEESNTNIFKAISVETFTILGWTVGSALHSIFTKKALSKAISDEPVSAKLSYGSYLTIIQLLIATITGVTIGYFHRSLSKQKQDSNEVPKDEPLVYNRNTDSSIISDNDFLVLNNGTEKENNNDLNASELECSKAPSIVLEMTSIYQELNKQSNSSISKHSKLNNPQVEYEYKTEHKYFFSYLCGSNEMILSAVLYAFANICANTALGGGKVMLVQIIKCSELILTAILSYIVLKRKVGLKESVAFGISTIGIFLVVSSTLRTSSTNSIAVTYSVLLASIGAFTISLRNVIVSSANKNEKAIDTFTLLSFWGMITSLIIFVGINTIYGQSKTEIALYPVIISGCFHAMYNFSSLAFLKLVGSPIVHAYFNLAKRAIIVLTAELINCTTPPSMQIFGSSLAILGIHFSKQSKTKDKQIENEETNKKNSKIMLHEEKLYHQKVNTEEVANIEQEEPKSCNKNDKYPYTASVVLSGFFIVIGWLLTYSYSCTGPPMETYSKMDSIILSSLNTTTQTTKPNINEQINQNIDVIRVVHEYYMEKLNDEDFKIRRLIDSDRDWFKKNKDLLILISQYRPILLSESMKNYKSIEDNIRAQGNILMIILEEILKDFKYGMVFGLADHENKGDAAINWAQYRVLEHFGINIVYYCTSNKGHKNCDLNESLRIAEKLQPPPIIILTGGGNLGNLWPVYEDERQHILNQFQNFNLIIFPQSIALSNLAAKNQFQKLLLYPNLKILIRDFYSFSFLSSQLNIDNGNSNLPKIYLTPDIVTSLAFIKKNNPGTEIQDHKKISPSWDILWISRQDREKNLKTDLDNEILKFVHENNEENENIYAGLANKQLKTSIHVDDWIKYSPTPYFGGIKKGRNILLSKVNAIQHNKPAKTQSSPSFDFRKSNEATFDEFSYGVSLQRFCRGLEFIYQGKVLISDRLHGHILALLSNMKHVLLDTKYNKISNYYKTWTYSIKDEILIADSNNNALQLASKLVINNEDLNLDLYYNEC